MTLEVLRREAGEPVQYITGRAAFRGLDLGVDPRVLIPRPETELLVEAVLDHLATQDWSRRAPRVLDLGTGSGCIALSIALEHPGADVTATDASEPALVLARENGGLYIKMGQGLSSMDHVLREEYYKTLAVLQDQAFGRPFEEVQQIFVEDFGAPPSEFFSEFEREPMAAASLAQVHRAVTKDGREHAIMPGMIATTDIRTGRKTVLDYLLKPINKAGEALRER